MYTISDEQIDFILSDFEARGIKNKELQMDLLDHVCCIIEAQLNPSDDFKAFYQKTIKTFYKSELKEIQEEIRVLRSNKYYYQMKKLNLPFGILALIGTLGGALFKVQHWPGASILLTLGGLFFNLWLLLQFAIAGQSDRRLFSSRAVNLLGLLAMISSVIGALFKIMHWPYAEIVMIVGLIFWFWFIFYLLIRGFRKSSKPTV